MQAAPSPPTAHHSQRAAGMEWSRQAAAPSRLQSTSYAATTSGISRVAAAHACVDCRQCAQRGPYCLCQQWPMRSGSDAAKAEAPSRQVAMQLLTCIKQLC